MIVALSLLIGQTAVPRTLEFKVYRCIEASLKDFEPVAVNATGTITVGRADRERLAFVIHSLVRKGKLKLVAHPKVKAIDGKEFRIAQSGSSDAFEIRGIVDVELVEPRIRLGFASAPGDAPLSSVMTWRKAESPVMWSSKDKTLNYFVVVSDDRPSKH